MADPVSTPSQTPNQPAEPAAVTAPPSASAATTPAPVEPASAKVEQPKVEPAPKAEAKPDPKAEAKPEAKAPAVELPAVTDAQARALADAAAQKAVTDKEAEEAAAAAANLEAYDIKLPEALAKQFEAEGLTLNPELVPALTPALKAAKLTNAQFNTVAAAFLEYQTAQPARMLARDLEVTAKDPVLGGMRYGQTLNEVKVALNAFADPDFQTFVAKSGIANRLEFVRVFQRIGAAMLKAGDSPTRGSPDAAPEETMAQRMYGRTRKN